MKAVKNTLAIAIYLVAPFIAIVWCIASMIRRKGRGA